MLVSLKEILKDAKEKEYAVGMFNMLNLETARGIIRAAEAVNSPVILGVAEVHLPIIPFDYAALIMNKMAEEAKVPVCLHFDHGVDMVKIEKALEAGFTSVMYDGSALPYEENVARSKEVTELARKTGASVEAELGHVGGTEGGADDGYKEQYTDPEDVKDFIEKTGVDALAVAIGTAHGQYKAKPNLDLGRLEKIEKISTVPLVLHGGSGLTDEDFIGTIKKGINKINICTELCVAADGAYKRASSLERGITEVVDAVSEIVELRMKLFGSANKA